MKDESKNTTPSLRGHILAAIKNRHIEMRSRRYFIFHAALALIGSLMLFLMLVYLISFIVFMLEQSGVWFVPVFGSAGWYEFFMSLPWLLIALSVLFIGFLEIGVWRYAFAYRQPLLYSALGVIMIVMLGSAVIMQMHMHENLLRAAEEDRLPFGGGWYRDLNARYVQNVHVGAIVEIASSTAFTMQNRRGEFLRVVVGGETQFPLGIDFVEGDTVVVFGEQDDDTVHALGIRKVDSEFGPPMMSGMSHHRAFYPFIVSDQRSPLVQIAAVKIPVEIATTTTAHQKGLSGRISLDADKGMFFIFARPDTYRFWMPDMHFPLDMIWIQDGKVVDISENVSNEFDPAAPKFYTPSSPVRYVLEVNAGFAMRHGIHIGDAVAFTNMK